MVRRKSFIHYLRSEVVLADRIVPSVTVGEGGCNSGSDRVTGHREINTRAMTGSTTCTANPREGQDLGR